jgi:Zn-dependent peptidase ImmA (M78 family)
MIIQGRLILTEKEIEEKAKLLLKLLRPDFFDYVLPTDLLSIAKTLTEKHRTRFDFKATLGFSENGERILGATNLKKWVILVDESLQRDQHMFNFTLAHELGHLALHRKLVFVRAENEGYVSMDTVKEMLFEKTTPSTEFEWLEWQANVYAAALLMPEEIVRKALVIQQQEMGIRRMGKIFLDHQPKNNEDYLKLLSRLSSFFGVSIAAITDRLKKLDLIEYYIPGVQSINQILSSGDWMPSVTNDDSPF